MAAKLIILCASLAFVNAGYLTAPHTVAYASPAITSQSANILRSPGNLAQISTFSKTIDTPYSSVRKSDVRISNPGIYAHAAPVVSYAAAAPALSYAHAAPAISYAHAAPAVSYAHAAPAIAYSSAPSVSHVSYSAAPVAYAAAPALAHSVAPLSYSYGPSYADHAVGSTHESTVRSLGGNSAVTHYSKAVDTAFSSVRKTDTRITNDAKIVAAAPALSYAAAYPAAYAAAPLVAKAAYAAPAIAYSAAPVVAHASYAAPAVQYAW